MPVQQSMMNAINPWAGWAAIWSDPALAKATVDDPNVYMAQIAATNADWDRSPFRDSNDVIIDHNPFTTGDTGGHCVARSTDRGITFPTVSCMAGQFFGDGTGLAVATDSTGARYVYLADTENFWRINGDGQTMSFTSIGAPFAFATGTSLGGEHYRLRAFGGNVYVATFRADDSQNGSVGQIVANYLSASDPSATWHGEITVVPNEVTYRPPPFSGLGAQINSFSFDLGLDSSGAQKFRVMAVVRNDPFGSGIITRECNVDLTGCHDSSWTTLGQTGNEVSPSLRYGGGRWAAKWLFGNEATTRVAVVVGDMASSGSLVARTIEMPVVPCGPNWGDYDELDAFGDGRFFAPHTLNGTGCRFGSSFVVDIHVGGSIFGF